MKAEGGRMNKARRGLKEIVAANWRRAIVHEVATRMLMGEFDSKSDDVKRFI